MHSIQVWLRTILALCAALVLAGCPAEFEAPVSLAGVAPETYPAKLGRYISTPSEGEAPKTEEFGRLIRDDDGLYRLIGDKPEENFPLHFYGPVAGYHVLEIHDAESDAYKFYVVQVTAESAIRTVEDDVYDYLGGLLFSALDLPSPEKLGVKHLTDNPDLNWALLQDLIVRFRDRFETERMVHWVEGD